MEHVPDWSALPTGPLGNIAGFCCTVIEDFMAFRGVCTWWRAAATKDKFIPVSKVPLLMLADQEDTDEREFYSLAKRKICTRIPLPDLMGKRCNDVGFGWILVKELTGEVCLMKPFSSSATRIPLPNFKNFPDYLEHASYPEDLSIHRAWLTANPSETSKFTLLVDGKEYLGFWNNGDTYWSKIEELSYFYLTCWKGKVYVLDFEEDRLLVWDSQEYFFGKPSELVVPIKNAPRSTGIGGILQDYLVASSDGNKLLLIRRNNHAGEFYANIGADHFGVFQVDLVRGEFIEINGLGKDAVFLGDNAPVAVDATEFPGVVKPNCIYFTDDCFAAYCHSTIWTKGGGKDMGIYNVGDGSIERFDVDSLSHTCPPMWVFPSI